MELPEPFVAALEQRFGEEPAVVAVASPPDFLELLGLEILPAVLGDLVALREQPAVVAAHAAPERVVVGAGEGQDLVDEAEVVVSQKVEADLGVLEEPSLREK